MPLIGKSEAKPKRSDQEISPACAVGLTNKMKKVRPWYPIFSCSTYVPEVSETFSVLIVLKTVCEIDTYR